MIYLGEQDKQSIIQNAMKTCDSVFLIGKPIEWLECDYVAYKDTILYKNYYDLQARITDKSLVIFNEVMVSTNRYLLNYNCMRKYVLARPKRLIFQYYPIKKAKEDFMILYDLDSDSPYLKQRYDDVKLRAKVGDMDFNWNKTDIVLTDKEIEGYYREKKKIIENVKDDPDIIPRRLLKYSEKLNEKHIGTVDRKDVIKPVMNIGLNQTGVDRYYFEKMQNFKRGCEDVKNKILGC